MARKKKEDSKLIYVILIVFIMFVFIILAEIIIFKKYINRDTSYVNSLFNSHINDNYYDTSNIQYTEVSLQDKISITSTCDGVCNIKVGTYYFLLSNENNKYKLNIVNDNKLITTKDLGDNIDHAYISSYEGNLYLYNIITNDTFKYDYMIIIDSNNRTDEFISLESNELEINDQGIIYYYDVCNNHDFYNAYKIKAIRKPFSSHAEELDRVDKNYPWCSN